MGADAVPMPSLAMDHAFARPLTPGVTQANAACYPSGGVRYYSL